MKAYRYAVIDCSLQQNANEGCNSYASLAGHGLVLSFIACFILPVIVPLDPAWPWQFSLSDNVLVSTDVVVDL